jgi:hypothetical protein
MGGEQCSMIVVEGDIGDDLVFWFIPWILMTRGFVPYHDM